MWWIVGVNALIYGVLALRALRTFQLTRRIGDLAVAAGLVWLAIAVATYLLSPVWSVGFWTGHVLELGAFVVVMAALVSDLARATPSRALHSEIDVQDVVTEQEALLGAWVGRLLERLAVKDTSTREHTRRVAQLSVAGRAGARAARRASARPGRRRAAARRRQAAGARRDPAQGRAAHARGVRA